MSSSEAENVGKCLCGGHLHMTGTKEPHPTNDGWVISFKVACCKCALMYDPHHKRFDHPRDHVQAELVLADPVY